MIGLILSVFAIVVIIGLTIAFFIYNHKQEQKRKEDLQKVVDQINNVNSTVFSTENAQTSNISNLNDIAQQIQSDLTTVKSNYLTPNVLQQGIKSDTATFQKGNIQTGNIQTGNLQNANIQTADIKTTNIETADIKTADIETANIQTLTTDSPISFNTNKMLSFPNGDSISYSNNYIITNSAFKTMSSGPLFETKYGGLANDATNTKLYAPYTQDSLSLSIRSSNNTFKDIVKVNIKNNSIDFASELNVNKLNTGPFSISSSNNTLNILGSNSTARVKVSTINQDGSFNDYITITGANNAPGTVNVNADLSTGKLTASSLTASSILTKNKNNVWTSYVDNSIGALNFNPSEKYAQYDIPGVFTISKDGSVVGTTATFSNIKSASNMTAYGKVCVGNDLNCVGQAEISFLTQQYSQGNIGNYKTISGANYIIGQTMLDSSLYVNPTNQNQSIVNFGTPTNTFLKVGAASNTGTTTAQVMSPDGNLYLDAKSGGKINLGKYTNNGVVSVSGDVALDTGKKICIGNTCVTEAQLARLPP